MAHQEKVRSLLWYVVALAIGVSIPLLVLSAIVAALWVQSERSRLEVGTFEVAGNALMQMDRFLTGKVAMLQALATSPALDDRDFKRFDVQARELFDLQGANIILRDLTGSQKVNTRAPWGAPLPQGSLPDANREVIRTKAPYVSDLYKGMISGIPLIRVVVPVLRKGEVIYTLTASLPPESLEHVLKSADVKPPYFASIADRQGRILARGENSGTFVGNPLPGFAEAVGDRGIWSGVNPQGVLVQAAYRRSPLSTWLVTVGVDRAALDAPFYRSLWVCGSLAAALCMCAFLASVRVGRRLVQSQRRVAETAQSLGRGEIVVAPETSILEANEVGDAMVEASAQLRAQALALADANYGLELRVEERTREVTAQAELLQVTLDNMDQGLLLVASDGTVPIANRRALNLLELPPALMAKRPRFEDVVRYQLERDDFAKSEKQLRQWVLAGGMERVQHDYERERPNGTILEIRTVPLHNGGAVRTYTDITERRRREIALRNAETEYRDLFENAVIGIYRSSPEGRTLRANPALVRLNGCETEQELLSATNDLGSEWYVDPSRREEFLRRMRGEGRITEFESEVYLYGSRTRIWISETAWTVHGPKGEVLWFEGTVSEITDRKRTEAEILHIASHDGLTGLLNRTFFREKLDGMFRNGSQPLDGLALLCLDLDRFKTVNDTLGHQVGDALLQQVAARIKEALEPGDLAARLGGDEFVVVQQRPDQPREAEGLARRLIDAMVLPFDLGDRLVNVGMSVGIAVLRDRQTSADQLFSDADLALYQAKAAGRNTFSVFEPGMNATQQQRRSLELDLRGAVERSEFFLKFQPAVDTRDRRVRGFEALVRWAHPIRGICAPGVFIPLAEETGLIVKIGDWVLRQACLTAASWPDNLTVAVNVSAMQFAGGELTSSVIRALAASKLPPERLELEITESVLLHDSAAVIDTLETLRSYGVRIALDDFGTGFSSLGYLRLFHFDKIKIDRSFVIDIENPITLEIVRAIVGLGKSRKIVITAEGVETRQQLERVSEEDCTEAQGYLFSPPMGAEKVLDFLRSYDASSLAA